MKNPEQRQRPREDRTPQTSPFLENLKNHSVARISAMQEEFTRTAMRIAFVIGGVILLATALPGVLAGAIAWAVNGVDGAARMQIWVFTAPIVALLTGAILVITFGPKSRRKIAEQERRIAGSTISLDEARRARARRAGLARPYASAEFEGPFARMPASDRDALQAELIREGIGLAVRFARMRNERKQEEQIREQREESAIFEEGSLREPGEEPRAA